MQAVEFLAMDLIRVQHRGVDERQPLAAAKHCRLSPAAEVEQHVEDLATPGRNEPGDTNGERVGD